MGELFPGFAPLRVETESAVLTGVHGGSGPPVLLLHGFPQTHAMWHEVATDLARDHTVVACDLRGYGDSVVTHTAGSDDRADYSFRAMAADQLAVMRSLGHDRFAVVGHDRGARVTHRMLLDSPDAVSRAALLDILPTAFVYAHADRAFATAYYHWFFLIQPADLPERMIAGDPLAFLHSFLASYGRTGLDSYHPGALAEYERCFLRPETVHAMCEDYRAAAGVDLEHDAEDTDRRVLAPLLVLWGTDGIVGAVHDPLAVWGECGTDVRGRAVSAGHFLVEQRPAEVIADLRSFLDDR